MHSIQSKLGSGLLLSLIIAFSLLWLVVSLNIQYLAEQYIASRLKHDADSLLSSLRINNSNPRDIKLKLNAARIGQIYTQPFSGHYYVINTNEESLSSRSLWDKKLVPSGVSSGETAQSLQDGPENQSLLVLSAGYQKQNLAITITVAEDLNPIKENIQQFHYWFAALAFFMLVTLIIFQSIILRWSLNPLNKTHQELKSLERGQLKKLSTDVPGELSPFINEVNRLLEIMEQRFNRSRNALSDLAHAIKKPLTVIQQLSHKAALPEETKTTLLEQVKEIYQLTDRILKRARLAGHSHTGARFSLSDDLPMLIKTLDMMYVNKTCQLNNTLARDQSCPVDREDMLELLGNLLDNAYKWSNKFIHLNISANNHSLQFIIEDDGPGAAPEKVTELSKRGIRLDEKTQGHGFGLAIANDIVNDYKGTLEFSQSSDLGGLKSEIKLPL